MNLQETVKMVMDQNDPIFTDIKNQLQKAKTVITILKQKKVKSVIDMNGTTLLPTKQSGHNIELDYSPEACAVLYEYSGVIISAETDLNVLLAGKKFAILD